MIQLQQNQTNRIAVNLKPQKSLTSTIYLMKLTSRMSEGSVYVIPAFISESDRATILEIDTSSTDALNGAIELNYGEYEVEIYNQTTTTLTPNGEPIYTTQAFVELSDVLYKVYNPTINPSKVYNG